MEPTRTSPLARSRRRFTLGALLLLVAVLAGVVGSTAEAAAYPNDPYYPRQWHLRRIGAPAAWKVTKGKGVTIAIVDTGVDRLHLDLAKNMSPLQYDAVNGTPDGRDVCPYSEPHRRKLCHGTSVAGAAAAVTNNGKGIAGVAPDAKIMAIRVSTPQVAVDDTAVLNGLIWAADHGAKVINMSLGASIGPLPFPDPWNLGILYATARGALVIAAAGNAATPLCSDPGENPLVVCVGASDQYDTVSKFSNYGVRIDVVAPGNAIWMTAVATAQDTAGFYAAYDGTSFASPIVAGVAAQLMSMGATNLQAAMILRGTAKDLGIPGYDLSYGFGRVDASAAVNLCKQVCAGAAR